MVKQEKNWVTNIHIRAYTWLHDKKKGSLIKAKAENKGHLVVRNTLNFRKISKGAVSPNSTYDESDDGLNIVDMTPLIIKIAMTGVALHLTDKPLADMILHLNTEHFD